MMDFASKNDFSKILNKLEAYTTLDSFNKMRINSEREYQDLGNKVTTLVPKSQLTRDLDNVKEFIGELNK